MNDPFRLDLPAVISFSGGRTSGYMLYRILQAFGGTLPDACRVIFNNTGKERLETLDFVERVSQRWSVPIHWLEYYNTPAMRKRKGQVIPGWNHLVREVDYATASRNGEPYDMAIRSRQILPNQAIRYCTGDMKIRTTNRFVRRTLGWEEYTNALGLRYDEPHRYAKLYSQKTVRVEQTLFGEEEIEEGYDAEKVTGEVPVVPLFHAKVTLEEVMAFWQEQRGGISLDEWLALPKGQRPDWDLELRPDEGNCDLCFLKGVQKLLKILRERPELAAWWIEHEKHARPTRIFDAGRFSKSRPGYAELLQISQQSELPLWEEVDELPCHCTD